MKLSLRDLFWLVVGLSLGWGLDRWTLARFWQREKDVQALEVANTVNFNTIDETLAELWELRGKHPDIDNALDDLCLASLETGISGQLG